MPAISSSKITQIVAGIAREDGGPSYSVPALSAGLSRLGASVTLRTLSGEGSQDNDVDYALSIHPKSTKFLGAAVRASRSLEDALLNDFLQGSIVHCHGLWLMPNVYPASARRKSGTGLIVHSPRGMLGSAALRISRWKKRPFWWLMQRSALRAADCLHATAASEYEEIRAAGLTNPVAIIPNGVDLLDLRGFPRNHEAQRTLLYLGRLHPKKGLSNLIHAWAHVEAEFSEWRLRIVGPAEVRHDQDLLGLAQSLNVPRISIEGPLYGRERLQAYRNADLAVLPTQNENFGIAVAEALAAELPVICTKGAPWSGLEQHRCGWWIDHGIESLAAALRAGLSTSRDELQEMGTRGREWMARDFSWDPIASEMLAVYQWLITGGVPPPSVQMN